LTLHRLFTTKQYKPYIQYFISG